MYIYLLHLVPDVVCVSFSQANYSVPENGGMAEFMVVADKEFTFTFPVEVKLMPDTPKCKHFLKCQVLCIGNRYFCVKLII